MQREQEFGFIYAIINIDGELAEISTKNKVEVKDWNYSQKKVNGRGIEAKSINENLELIKSQIRQKYRDLQHEPNVITAASVKASYLGVRRKLKGKKIEDQFGMRYCATLILATHQDMKSFNKLR